NVSVVVRGTLMQTLTPDEMRGRVAAVNSVFISSSNELGAFESGATAARLGPVASVVAGGVGTILVVLLAAWRWPALLRLGAAPRRAIGVHRQGWRIRAHPMNGLAPGLLAQPGCKPLARSKVKPALPYICRLIVFSLFTWPSTGPLLHPWVIAAETAASSRR